MNTANIPEKQLIDLRHKLHQHAELSGEEEQSAQIVADFLAQFEPTEIIRNIGGHGLIAIYDSGKEGPTVLFRGEIDALPIPEELDLEYASKNEGVAHKCGHDGHTAMVAALAPMLKENPIQKGKVILLFQPSEENGEGAAKMLEDEKLKDLQADYVFALHNLPGIEEHKIIIRDKVFAAASEGLVFRMTGKTSHAAEPENGISPANAMSDILKELLDINMRKEEFSKFTIVTPIYANLGEKSFGTSPGYAEMGATLRSFSEEDLEKLKKMVLDFAEKKCKEEKLELETEWVDPFPVTKSDSECVEKLESVAKSLNLQVGRKEQPYKWSEDFGQFTKKFKGAFFGLGAGKDHPALHNPDYDFPDEIGKTGTSVFYGLIKEILG